MEEEEGDEPCYDSDGEVMDCPPMEQCWDDEGNEVVCDEPCWDDEGNEVPCDEEPIPMEECYDADGEVMDCEPVEECWDDAGEVIDCTDDGDMDGDICYEEDGMTEKDCPPPAEEVCYE